MLEVVAIALGSNLGDRAAHLGAARRALAALPGTRVLRVSTVEETAPLGGLDQPAYLNQVALVETSLEPRALLEACQAIERAEGRTRGARWASRSARDSGSRRLVMAPLMVSTGRRRERPPTGPCARVRG